MIKVRSVLKALMTELQNRGVKDVLIACVDELTGFPEAIEAVFPKTKIQLCIVHLIRNSLKYVSFKGIKEMRRKGTRSDMDNAHHKLEKCIKSICYRI